MVDQWPRSIFSVSIFCGVSFSFVFLRSLDAPFFVSSRCWWIDSFDSIDGGTVCMCDDGKGEFGIMCMS